MDVKSLLAESKARFSHNSAKQYLKEKYEARLMVADQNGLWKADKETITFLDAFKSKKIVLMDTFNNPVEIDRASLLNKLKATYEETMSEWLEEHKQLESNR